MFGGSARTSPLTLVAFQAGEALTLRHSQTGSLLALLVEPVRGGVMLARPAQPYHRLHRSLQRVQSTVYRIRLFQLFVLMFDL